MDVFSRTISAAELRRRTGDLAAFGGIREVVLDNGVGRGVRVAEVRTSAGLGFDVLLDRALDLGSATFGGSPFGWRSGNGFRHPGLHENADEDGLSWLRSLDGLLVTAGLDHTLFGGEVDASNYRYPPKQSLRNGLHGRLTAIPGRLLEAAEIWSGEHGTLRIRGEVVQATSFGEHLRLTRTIETDFDGAEIRLHDVVDNLGFEPTPHMFLYHFNFGWPLVDAGTELVAPIRAHAWASESVAEQGASYRLMGEPVRGFVEQVVAHELVADRDGRHRAALVDRAGTNGVELSWDAASMPHFFVWQNLRDGQYAVGLEPSSHGVAGDRAARADGSMVWLEHGDSVEYRTTLTVLRTSAEVEASRHRIRSVHGQPGVTA